MAIFYAINVGIAIWLGYLTEKGLRLGLPVALALVTFSCAVLNLWVGLNGLFG